MQISSRFTIAVHIFACIEAFGDQHKLTSDFLAGSVNVNPVIIRKTMSQLQKAGLIKVARGTGGIKITRPLDEITLFDVFQAVEALDHKQLFHFHDNPNPSCPVGRNIHNILDGHLHDARSSRSSRRRRWQISRERRQLACSTMLPRASRDDGGAA